MKLLNVTDPAFLPYGKLVDFSPNPENELFEIVVEEPIKPWRIAMLKVVRKEATRLERHPNSMETFEPVKGVGVLLVSEDDSMTDVKAFLLDAPICLHKGVWHEVMTLSTESFYKLTENHDVVCEYIDLPKSYHMEMVSE